MGDKGKRDKGKREDQKRGKRSLKERRKQKKSEKSTDRVAGSPILRFTRSCNHDR